MFNYQECHPLVIQTLSNQAPTIDEFCNCARNEINQLEDYKSLLDCTLWPNDNYWRTFTLYQRAKQACVPRGQPKVKWMAEDVMEIYRLTKSSDDAMEAHQNLAVTTSSPVLIVDALTLGALRFDHLNINQGAKVLGAYLGMQPSGGAADMNNTVVTISVEATNGNSAAFRARDGDISNRVLDRKALTTMIVGAAMPSKARKMMWTNVAPQLKSTVKKKSFERGNAMTLVMDYTSGQALRVLSADTAPATGIGPMMLVYLQGLESGGSAQRSTNGGSSDNGGMSGGAVFGVILVVFLSLGAIGYGAMYYSKNKTLFTSFRQDTQFKAFHDENGDGQASAYAPPSGNSAV